MDKKHDASLYSLINCMCNMRLQYLSFRQWRCYAKIKLLRKIRMKSGTTSTRTFTLQPQSNVGEPWIIVAFIYNKVSLIFAPILEIKGSKRNHIKLTKNASEIWSGWTMNICSLYLEKNSPWFSLQYWKSRAQTRYHMKLTKIKGKCNHIPKLQGKWGAK